MSMRSTWGEPSGSLLTLLKNIHIIYWLNKTELGKESKIEHQQQLKTASAGNWQRNSLAFNPTWDFNIGKFSFRKSCWNNKSCTLFLQHEGHEKVLLLQIIFFLNIQVFQEILVMYRLYHETLLLVILSFLLPNEEASHSSKENLHSEGGILNQ